MAEVTNISWAHATFNCVRGCTRVAPECAKCYAADLSLRNPKTLGQWGDDGVRVVAAESYWLEPVKWNLAAAAGVCPDCGGRGYVAARQKAIVAGMKGEKIKVTCQPCKSTGRVEPHRRRVFCMSLADVFENWQGKMHDHKARVLWGTGSSAKPWEGLPAGQESYYAALTMADVRARLFSLIMATPNLDWLLLTKRPESIRSMWPRAGFPEAGVKGTLGRYLYLDNVWLGTSAGTQRSADKYVWPLLQCHDFAKYLFVSDEPMLDAVQYDNIPILSGTYRLDAFKGERSGNITRDIVPTARLSWLIGGVESSGPRLGRLGAFANEDEWLAHLHSLNQKAVAAGVAMFNKQIPLGGKLVHNVNEFPPALRRQEFPCQTI